MTGVYLGDNNMSIWKRIKNKLNEFLEKMARDNEKAFGNGKLDCCQLNNKDQNNRNR
jgi:hypothetical protein